MTTKRSARGSELAALRRLVRALRVMVHTDDLTTLDEADTEIARLGIRVVLPEKEPLKGLKRFECGCWYSVEAPERVRGWCAKHSPIPGMEVRESSGSSETPLGYTSASAVDPVPAAQHTAKTQGGTVIAFPFARVKR